MDNVFEFESGSTWVAIRFMYGRFRFYLRTALFVLRLADGDTPSHGMSYIIEICILGLTIAVEHWPLSHWGNW